MLTVGPLARQAAHEIIAFSGSPSMREPVNSFKDINTNGVNLYVGTVFLYVVCVSHQWYVNQHIHVCTVLKVYQ